VEQARTAHESPFGPTAAVTADETFEWLPGGQFLVHRLQGRVGDREIACIEVTGGDASGPDHSTYSFYGDGRTNTWQLRDGGTVWTLTGSWQLGGEMLQVRCRVEFSDAGNTMAETWEYSRDGRRWPVFWDARLTRVPGSHLSTAA
jgi:hypothetical protein